MSRTWERTRPRARHTRQRGKMRKIEDMVEMRSAAKDTDRTWKPA